MIHELHNNIDAAVADAYGWRADLPDQEILARLVGMGGKRIVNSAGCRHGQIRIEEAPW